VEGNREGRGREGRGRKGDGKKGVANEGREGRREGRRASPMFAKNVKAFGFSCDATFLETVNLVLS